MLLKIKILFIMLVVLTLSCDRFSTLSFSEWSTQNSIIYLNIYSPASTFQQSVLMTKSVDIYSCSSTYYVPSTTFLEIENKTLGKKYSTSSMSADAITGTSANNASFALTESSVANVKLGTWGGGVDFPIRYNFNIRTLTLNISN